MPNVYMEVGTMLANMLNEAVRSAQLKRNRQWQELKDVVVSHLGQTGMAIDTIETQAILPSSSLLTITGRTSILSPTRSIPSRIEPPVTPLLKFSI